MANRHSLYNHIEQTHSQPISHNILLSFFLERLHLVETVVAGVLASLALPLRLSRYEDMDNPCRCSIEQGRCYLLPLQG
jgi:hypothetical protein